MRRLSRRHGKWRAEQLRSERRRKQGSRRQGKRPPPLRSPLSLTRSRGVHLARSLHVHVGHHHVDRHRYALRCIHACVYVCACACMYPGPWTLDLGPWTLDPWILMCHMYAYTCMYLMHMYMYVYVCHHYLPFRKHTFGRQRALQMLRWGRLRQMQLLKLLTQSVGSHTRSQYLRPSSVSTTSRLPSRLMRAIPTSRCLYVVMRTVHAVGAITSSTGCMVAFVTGQWAPPFVWLSCWLSSPSTSRSSRRWVSALVLHSRLSRSLIPLALHPSPALDPSPDLDPPPALDPHPTLHPCPHPCTLLNLTFTLTPPPFKSGQAG